MHIYTQNNTINSGRARAVPGLGELYPGICLTSEKKARKNLSPILRLTQAEPSVGPLYMLPESAAITYSCTCKLTFVELSGPPQLDTTPEFSLGSWGCREGDVPKSRDNVQL